MKKTTLLLTVILSLLLIVGMIACSNKEQTNDQTPTQGTTEPSGEQQPPHTHSYGEGTVTTAATYNAAGIKTYTCSCGEKKTESIPSLCPNAAQVVQGIQSSAEQTKKSYDFDITLNGQINVMGFTGNGNAVYSGKYRYDKTTSQLRFERTTSGNILYNTHEYIYSEGDSRVKVSLNKQNKVKNISISAANNEELNMFNLPFVEIIEALKADNLSDVKKDSSKPNYKFSAAMKFSSGFTPIEKLLTYVGVMGANISIKNVTFTNPQGGVKVYFNLTDDGKLADYTFAINVSFPISGQTVSITLDYQQKSSSTEITLPNIKNYISDSDQKSSLLSDINSAINAVKGSSAYSLDLTAENNFDAGWNKTAVVDKYISRMYKNTNDGRVDFNHSYLYKSHTEEDGKENFKYTVGNIQDGSVYMISRKGTNAQTPLPDVGINDRFDIHLTGMNIATNDVDFIYVVNNSDGSTTYNVFLKAATGTNVQKKICDLINSNEGDDVVPVENYFNENDYRLEECDCSFTVKSGKLVSALLKTELRYSPTDGDSVGSIVTLKNSITLSVNENLDKAQEYSAPKNVETKLGSYGLNNAKYYIQ